MNELKPVAWMWGYRGFAFVTTNMAKAMELQQDPKNEVTPLYAIPEQVKAQWQTGALYEIARIAHHGGLIGFRSDADAMVEIRRLTIEAWDKSARVASEIRKHTSEV